MFRKSLPWWPSPTGAARSDATVCLVTSVGCLKSTTCLLCVMKPADVRRHTVESLKVAPLGDGHHGRDFYKYFFTSHPEHRHFYKGAENYTGDDVEKSERFDKLGDAILLFVHVLANVCENESVYRSFVRRVMYEHFDRSIDPALWKPFWDYWVGFLESKGPALTAEQKEAWKNFGTVFNAECQAYLTRMERPHA
ncbi:unnamed protein product [Cylicocyclus nassatus]|uniref:Globin domain-containing protein n=1 Tax=Cylicocyclus nassatus TaxID=53992 RepID=A0AA36H8Q5_CYLNA|nr:unnamed protein product [Cylicocyclus nassatus]